MLKHYFRIFMTLLISVVTVVACAPPKNQETLVRIYKRANQDKALATCERSISSKYDVNVGKSQQELKAPICQSTIDESGKLKKETSEVDVGYRIGNRNGQLVISLDVGVEFSGEVDEKSQARAAKILQAECAPALAKIWKRSFKNVALSLSFTPISSDDVDSKYDQYLTLNPDSKMERLTLQGWPERGFFELAEAEKNSAKCAKVKASKRGECLSSLFWQSQANANFCKTVSSLVGHWLNRPEKRAQDGQCDSEAKIPDGMKEQDDSFQDFVVADPRSATDPFWEKARFSRADLQVILKPACAKFE